MALVRGLLLAFLPLLLALPASSAPGGLPATVVRVVDGDTVQVRIGDRLEKVRYIGMNAPEVHHPRKGEEPGGREASEVKLVRRGYGQVMTIPPNVRYQEMFVTLQREAREAGRGLWHLVPVRAR